MRIVWILLLSTVIVTHVLARIELGPDQPRLPGNSLRVPLVPQATKFSCGAASLMAVLEYWNVYDGPETLLYEPLGTNENDGTAPESIANLAKQQYGLWAEIRTGLGLQDLRDALKDGTTVILDLQAWTSLDSIDWKNTWEEGHYVVLTGMDANYAYFMDPSVRGSYAYLPLPELLDRWHDYDYRPGYLRRFYSLGILIHGENPRTQFPGLLVRMN